MHCNITRESAAEVSFTPCERDYMRVQQRSKTLKEIAKIENLYGELSERPFIYFSYEESVDHQKKPTGHGGKTYTRRNIPPC